LAKEAEIERGELFKPNRNCLTQPEKGRLMAKEGVGENKSWKRPKKEPGFSLKCPEINLRRLCKETLAGNFKGLDPSSRGKGSFL